MITKLVSIAVLTLFLSGCGGSSIVGSSNSIENVMENYIRNEMAGDTPAEKDNRIIFMCSQTRDTMQTETDLLTNTLGELVDEFKALDFNSLTFDIKFKIWTDACRKVISERPELKEKFDQVALENSKIAIENSEKSKRLQKQADILNKKVSKIGGGSYYEMLEAEIALEILIERGAQFSLTGQSREVEEASCSPTTYSSWFKGEPGGTWYCYMYFLDGSEPYTINVSGARWGGVADKGSSAGDFVEFKVSDELREWLIKQGKR